MTFVFLAIMTVAFSIIARYYNMALDMDALTEEKSMRPVAVFDTCKGIFFNAKEINKTAFKLLWHNSENKIYINGADEWNVQKNIVSFGPNKACSELIVWTIPY